MAGFETPARKALRAIYPSATWHRKVDRMSDEQVAAIYLRMKKEGKIK